MSDGKGCKCGAYGSYECGCPDVDWTPQEIYDLKAKIIRLEKKLSVYEEQEKRWLSQMVVGDYDACNTLCDALEMQGRDIQVLKNENAKEYSKGWNEAIEASAKVAEDFEMDTLESTKEELRFYRWLKKKIADKLKGLKK